MDNDSYFGRVFSSFLDPSNLGANLQAGFLSLVSALIVYFLGRRLLPRVWTTWIAPKVSQLSVRLAKYLAHRELMRADSMIFFWTEPRIAYRRMIMNVAYVVSFGTVAIISFQFLVLGLAVDTKVSYSFVGLGILGFSAFAMTALVMERLIRLTSLENPYIRIERARRYLKKAKLSERAIENVIDVHLGDMKQRLEELEIWQPPTHR